MYILLNKKFQGNFFEEKNKFNLKKAPQARQEIAPKCIKAFCSPQTSQIRSLTCLIFDIIF